MDDVFRFPGGHAFFSSILYSESYVDGVYVGAFFTTDNWPRHGINDFVNTIDHDVPLTAILIPF